MLLNFRHHCPLSHRTLAEISPRNHAPKDWRRRPKNWGLSQNNQYQLSAYKFYLKYSGEMSN